METKNAQASSQRFWTILLYLALLGVLIWFVTRVSSILGYFALAGAIAYILNPAVERLSKKRIPRMVATLLIFTVFAAILAVILIAIIPPAFKQFEELIKDFPTYAESLQDLWAKLLHVAKSSNLPANIQSLPDKFSGNLQQVGENIGKTIFDGITGFLSKIPTMVIVPILVFYFLSDGPNIRKSLIAAVPPKLRTDTEELLSRINSALGGFIRGQLKLCAVMGFTTFIVYLWPMPKYSLFFGLIAGVTEFIPYVGPILALIGPLIVALFISPATVIYVLIAFAVLQVLEGNILAPKIIGKDCDLHPAIIIFVLMCGGELAGLAGMIAAIPVAVTVKVLYNFFYTERYLKLIPEAPLVSDSAIVSAEPADDTNIIA
ncbi:MAG: AI-2E family transporter [bacterium]